MSGLGDTNLFGQGSPLGKPEPCVGSKKPSKRGADDLPLWVCLKHREPNCPMLECWKQRIYEAESQLKILREGQKHADIVMFECTVCGLVIDNGRECSCGDIHLDSRPDGTIIVHMYAHVGNEPYDSKNIGRYQWNVGQNFRKRK